ncbi:MAG: hypothetical protein AUH92_06060 [Acidobacteria bacterium 13_1_40CM_4_69_4]|nr:MAG: hypothetical protein AUH92_06060 [Acidobacteria bacterium 13_1_40CM_4_69_4]
MSGPPSRRGWFRISVGCRILRVLVLAFLCVACSKENTPRRTAGQGVALYNQGKYAEALPLLQRASETGLKDGVLLYQLGYCREVVEQRPDVRRGIWKEAAPLLGQEVSQPGGATLERLYYLTVISSDQGAYDRMAQYARQAVEQFEKGPNPNALSGEDWFRLARLHDFLQEASEAEAAYRRSASVFFKSKGGSASYHSLALAKVGDLDLSAEHYRAAAGEFDEALRLFPDNQQVRPFHHALALLAVRRFDDAIARFGMDHGESNIESQYGADLARKMKEVAPLDSKDVDGSTISDLSEDGLLVRVREAAKAYRAAREKNKFRKGDPLPAEVALYQKRFVGLLAEHFLRTKSLQEFCLKEGIADLVRR